MLFMLWKCNWIGARAEPSVLIMSSNGSSSSGNINWCQFVPLRGDRPIQHVAPAGKLYCVRHQGYVTKREATAERKREEAEALEAWRMQRQAREEASCIRSRSKEKELLSQLSEDAQEELQEASEGEPSSAKPTIQDLMASMLQMQQILAQLQISQQGSAPPPSAAMASSSPAPAPAQPLATNSSGKGKGKGKGKGSVLFAPRDIPDSEQSEDFSKQ